MMIRIAAHLFEVVVLATDAQTLLRVSLSATLRFAMAEDDVFKLIHSGIGKHQRGIIFDHHRGRGYDQMPFALKESFERFAYLVSCHILLFYGSPVNGQPFIVRIKVLPIFCKISRNMLEAQTLSRLL